MSPKLRNLERVVYVGDRDAVGKEYERRRYIFKRDKAIAVPEEFAARLIASMQFVHADDYGKPLVAVHPKGGQILFRRWGAMGDLLMFRAAVAAFVRVHPEYQPILRCQDRFAPTMADDPLWTAVVGIGSTRRSLRSYVVDGVFSFDQVAEADHRGDERHRVALFLSAMSKEPIEVTADDWAIPSSLPTQRWVQRHLESRVLLRSQRDRPLVALQTCGSGAMKSLPQQVGIDLAAALADAGLNVMMTEPDEPSSRQYVVRDQIFTLTGRDPLHVIEMMRHCDLTIAMDSAPLWMAHCANCPVLAILGPTRPEQRISFHPQYPERARAVCLNELIECPACFERAEACKGTFRCMQDQPDWRGVIDLIVSEAVAMTSGDVRLPVAEASNQACRSPSPT